MNQVIDGWLEFSGQKAVFSVSKIEKILNEDGDLEEHSETDFTTEEKTGPVCISQGNEPTVNIEGVVKFKDGTTFDEPEGGWNLSNFIAMIGVYEMERRRKPENYFLGGFDYQHVLWAGMDKVDDYFVIHWDS
ncbi:MAG: hypothetical protein CMD74_02565 [Gammaproteobacteria bacterium]|nr:hypothetical protein [Gammaproteobacteria bacterium]